MILFYNIDTKPYGCFSNLAPYGVELDGKWWPTVEHYFQAMKFADTPYTEMIRLTEDPIFVARIGKWRQLPLRPDWDQVKDTIMRRAVLRKFELHYSIKQVLLDTDDAPIVENAPNDYYWGIGADGSGKNKLGCILMDVRAQLR